MLALQRWVDNNLALVLFKNHYLSIFLHKVTYMSMPDNTKRKRHINGGNKEKYTCMYKKQYKQELQCINIPRDVRRCVTSGSIN